MGWWGERAKDGDHPLDLLGRWEDSGKTAKAFVNAELKDIPSDDDGYFKTSWVGLVTLLCEKGYRFNNKVYEQALKWSSDKMDKKFFKQMLETGEPLVKKKFVVSMDIEIEEMDEEQAVKKACDYAKLSFWNNLIKDKHVKMKVNGVPHTKTYSDRY